MPAAPGAVVARRYILLAGEERRFRARDEVRGDEVVVELLEGPSGWLRAAEGCIARLASQPVAGVVAIRGFGRQRRALYLAVEPCVGSRLDELAGPWSELARRLAEALRVLGAVHALGIRHGAFEIDTLRVTDEGLVLTELGRCQPFGAAADALGTPAYVAPELVAGRYADGRADLFSAGVVLRRLADGRADAPEAVHGLIASLLQADPEARPSSAAEVAEAVERLEQPPRAPSAEARALSGLAEALREAPDAVATAERAAELVEDLLAKNDAVGVETVIEVTAAARRAHPTAWLSAARAVVAAFVSVPATLAAIDVLAASHPAEAIAAIALLRRGRRAAPLELYKRAGLAYLAAGREDRAAHFLSRIFPPGRDLRSEIARLRAEVAHLRARCGELERTLDRERKRARSTKVVDTRADRERSQDERLRRTLRETDWNVSETARRLGISRPTVYRRMRRLGLGTDATR